jgi:2-phosphosulfolactate phosphatase
MKINKLDFVAGAQQAQGIAVIIDVFRAFSVACYCYSKGVDKIYPVATLEQALAFKSPNKKVVTIGERNGYKLPKFTFGNSPTEIVEANVKGNIVVQTTHAGTQGLVNATNAKQVLTGALVNAKATANFIKAQNPAIVSLVRMGHEATHSTDEDDICADYLESLLLDDSIDRNTIKETLLASPCADRFKDPQIPWNPMSDFDLCTDVDKFDFVLQLTQEENGLSSLTVQRPLI